MYSHLTGYKIFCGSKDELVSHVQKILCCSSDISKLNIVSGNPEVLLNGINSNELGCFFKRDDNIIIPDGVGVIILLKIFKKYVTEKIAGIEIMEEILKILNTNENLSVYFLGATKESLELAIKNIKNIYKNINVKGYHDGYFTDDENENVVKDIRDCDPDVLFIAMGSPKQDIFIKNNMYKLNCKIFMGVGGSFDLYSGKVKRAPKFMIRFGLEWLYRVANEPFRIRRLSSIPKFFLRSLSYQLKGRLK